MIKLEEVFADFQMMGHRVIESTYRCPMNLQNDTNDLFIEFDYEIIESEVKDDQYFGVVVFQISIKVSNEDQLENLVDCVLDAGFIGNPARSEERRVGK